MCVSVLCVREYVFESVLLCVWAYVWECVCIEMQTMSRYKVQYNWVISVTFMFNNKGETNHGSLEEHGVLSDCTGGGG